MPDLLDDIDAALSAHEDTIGALGEAYFADAMAGVRDAIDGLGEEPYCDALECAHGQDADGYPCEGTLARWRPVELEPPYQYGPPQYPWDNLAADYTTWMPTGLAQGVRMAIDRLRALDERGPRIMVFTGRGLSSARVFVDECGSDGWYDWSYRSPPQINAVPRPPTRPPVVPVDLLHAASQPTAPIMPVPAWRSKIDAPRWPQASSEPHRRRI